MKKIISISIFAFTSTLMAKPNLPPQVDAAAKNLYGAAASYKYDCTACHGASGFNLSTGFGVDFLNYTLKINPGVNVGSLSNAQVQAVISAMSQLDSDKDTANNQQEFISGTNPGDPASKPAAAPVCVRANPVLSLSPVAQSGVAGSALTYNLAVSNRDSAECMASTFNLSSMAASGLAVSLAATAVTINPGQSSTVKATVTSAANLAAGNYMFSLGAVNAAVTNYTGSVNGTYTVMTAADTLAPTAPANVVYVQEKSKYIISWTASTDNFGVVGYRVFVDGVLAKDVTVTSAAVRLRRGTHAITVKAYDAAGNLSNASVAINIVK